MPILSGVISSAIGVPGAPTIGTATISGTTATVPFTAPSDNGGSTITSYTAVSSPSGITGTLSQAGSGSVTVSGLSAGTSYTFTVFATNAFGNSPSSSASNSITAVASGVAFTTAGGYVSYGGGARNDNYIVTYSDDNSSWTTGWTGNAAASSCGINQWSGGASVGAHRYWRIKTLTNSGSHFPRCARFLLNSTTIRTFTSDNCSDAGEILGMTIPNTVWYDAVSGTSAQQST
jgi:hypothetical protein